MAIKILTPDYELHIQGYADYYTPDIEWQLIALMDDIVQTVRKNSIDIHHHLLHINCESYGETVDVGYINWTIGPAGQVRIAFNVTKPDSLHNSLEYKYGTLIYSDKSKQQLLDLLNGNYREEMRNG